MLLTSPVRFVLVGAANTAFTLAVILALQTFTGPYVANAIGYVAGLALSFVLNARWTFSQSRLRGSQAVRFLVVFLFAYGANFATLRALLLSGVGANLAQLLAMPIYTAVFFVLCRVCVFPRVASREP